MSTIKLGIIAGLVYGAIEVLMLFVVNVPNIAVIAIAAFVTRFTIGLLIPNTNLRVPYWLQGLIIGILVSIPGALLSRNYVPTMSTGIIGGLIIGAVTQKFVKKEAQASTTQPA